MSKDSFFFLYLAAPGTGHERRRRLWSGISLPLSYDSREEELAFSDPLLPWFENYITLLRRIQRKIHHFFLQG